MNMLRSDKSALVVIDVQERLLPRIHDAETTVTQITRLMRGFQLVGAPVLLTEQYRKGLGPTEPRILEAYRTPVGPDGAPVPDPPAANPILEKMSFSCCGDGGFRQALEATERRQIVLCGIESHVCVLQTALHLRDAGYDCYVAADAVSSRSPRNVEIALRRMEAAGVVLTSCESAIFEMLEVCGTPAFKAWSRLIR